MNRLYVRKVRRKRVTKPRDETASGAAWGATWGAAWGTKYMYGKCDENAMK